MENYDYICYFDGACEPTNPGGAMGIGAIILDREKNKLLSLSHYAAPKPENTNNVAEYQAFGWTIRELLRITPQGANILVQGDSKLVIEQMKGNWQMKQGAYIQYAKRAKVLLFELGGKCKITLRWIPRDLNDIADKLSKEPMIANNVKFIIQPQ